MKISRWLIVAGLAVVVGHGSAFGTSLLLVRTFPAPSTTPNGMTFVGDDLWLWNIGGPDMFYVLDPSDGNIQASYPAPETGGGAGLGYDGQYLWGSAGGTDLKLFSKMDAQDGSVIESFPLPVPDPTGIAFDGTNLWVSQIDGYSIAAVDPATGAVIRTIQKEPCISFDLAWDGATLWLAWYEEDGDEVHSYMSRIDPATGATLAVYDGPAGVGGGMAIKEDLLFVSSWRDDLIYVYELPERVPEPASLLIVIIGCTLVGGRSKTMP